MMYLSEYDLSYSGQFKRKAEPLVLVENPVKIRNGDAAVKNRNDSSRIPPVFNC